MNLPIKLRWKILASILMFNNKWLAIKLLVCAFGKPYTHLPGYMKRWWLIKHPDIKGERDFGTVRNWLRNFYPVYARFHQILRADDGRDHHDHPFDFTSIILAGWYTEERVMPTGIIQTFTYGQGEVNSVKRGEFHRIVAVSEGGVVTLVFHGKKKHGTWGFLVDGKWIPWRKYHNVDLMPHEVRHEVKTNRININEDNT